MKKYKALLPWFLLLWFLIFTAAYRAQVMPDIIVTGGAWYDVRAYSNFEAAVAAAGSTDTILVLENETISGSVTLQSGQKLWILKGVLDGAGSLDPYSPQNLICGDHQEIFGSTLTVTFTINGPVSPALWGFGNSGSNSAAIRSANTSALDAAMAATANVILPEGTYYLNKLTTITTSGARLKGEGSRKTILVFNSDGDDCLTIGSSATYGVVIEDIDFDNDTGTTPTSFIKLAYAVHARLFRLGFRNAAATYAIDHVQGHSIDIIEPEFATFTGTGIRLRYNGSEYSNLIRILRLKSGNSNVGDCIEIEGGNNISLRDDHFEQWTNAIEYSGGEMLRGLVIDGCYFENITKALTASDGASEYIRNGHMVNCRSQSGAGAIHLGSKSQLRMTNCVAQSNAWAVTAEAASNAVLSIDETIQWTADDNIAQVHLHHIRDFTETVTGAVNLKPYGISLLNSSGGAVTATLPDGQYEGQRKAIGMSDSSNPSTASVTNHETSDPEVFTANATTDWLILEWMGSQWITMKNSGWAT